MSTVPRIHPRQRWWFIGLAAGILAAVVLSLGVVYAHVSVEPSQVPPNSSQTFRVRVPTERNVATVQVRVEFPAGLTVSRFQPKPGWTREVERDSQQRITAVTWSGGRIEPGEFEEFVFIARTPAEEGTLLFKAWQTYEGGETVAWVNTEEPNPAARVEVRRVGSTAAMVTEEEHAEDEVTVTTAQEAPASSSGLPLFLSLVSLVVALAALVLAFVAVVRQRAGAGA